MSTKTITSSTLQTLHTSLSLTWKPEHKKLLKILRLHLHLSSHEEMRVLHSFSRTPSKYSTVLIVLDPEFHTKWQTNQHVYDALFHFYKILKQEYPTQRLQITHHGVRLITETYTITCIPAYIQRPQEYIIPDAHSHAWIPYSPIDFEKMMHEVNWQMQGGFFPLVEAVHSWNEHANVGIDPFHLNSILYDRYCTYTSTYPYTAMLKCFFERLPTYLSQNIINPSSPFQQNHLSEIHHTEREHIFTQAEYAAQRSAAAFSFKRSRPHVSAQIWKNLLGCSLPEQKGKKRIL